MSDADWYTSAPPEPFARLVALVAVVADPTVTEPGLVVVHEWTPEDLDRGWKMFESLLTFWKLKNKFDPSA